MTSPAPRAEVDGGSLDALFGALSDPTRRMLVERLLKKGPSTATVLAETTPLTRQAVLKHLQVLEAAGLLDHERAGREVRYRVTPQPLASAVGWILDTAGTVGQTHRPLAPHADLSRAHLAA